MSIGTISASPGQETDFSNVESWPPAWKTGSEWFLRQVWGRALTLWLVSLFLFVLFRIIPGDAQQISALGQPGSPVELRSAASGHGFALAISDYLKWLGNALILDFGTSVRYGLSVSGILADHLAVSIVLGTAALLLFYLLAFPLGVASATRYDRWTGKLLNRLFDTLYTLPAFWVSLLLLMLLCGGDYLALFPVTGLSSADGVARGWRMALIDRIWHMILPVVCLSYAGIGYVAQQVRSATLECLSAEFLLAAKARGLKRSEIIRRHVVPHALLPVIALTAQLFPALFAGSVVVETVFSLPGMGRLTLDSVLARDYPVLLAIGFLSAAISLAGGLLVEMLMRHFYPRWEGE